MENKKYLVYLHSLGISQKKLFSIFEKEKNYKDFFENLNLSSLKAYFSQDNQIQKILEKKEKLKYKEIDTILEKNAIKIIVFWEQEYPKLLQEIAIPPFFLYVRGILDNSPKLAIIGSRKISEYGKKIIEKITPSLLPYFNIVSGWAIGCDSLAHEETLKNEWKTIVIIGTWIDICYPATNKRMYEKVVEKWGAIVSIFPLWEWPNPYNFPIRNEIIAWISNGVIVVEAWEKSGTLITANLALEQGKDLFAVPWDIFKAHSLWCNKLIKSWEAKPVSMVEDILEEYNITNFSTAKTINFCEKLEKDIYDLLIVESLTLDEIAKRLSISVSEVAIKISFMEIKWYLKKTWAWKYEII